jgi:hypothetical protein
MGRRSLRIGWWFMSLLEAFTALVILGLTAVGYLEVFQSGAQSAVHAEEWQRIVAEAESTMEGASLAGPTAAVPATASTDGYARRVDVRAYAAGVSEIVVTVTSPRGTQFTLHRLVREASR